MLPLHQPAVSRVYPGCCFDIRCAPDLPSANRDFCQRRGSNPDTRVFTRCTTIMLLLAYSAPGKDKTDAVKKKGGRAVGFCLTSMLTDRMSDKLDIHKIVLIPKSQSAEHFKQTLSRATCNAEGPCCPVFSACRVDLTIPVSLHTCPNVFPLSRIALSSLSGNP